MDFSFLLFGKRNEEVKKRNEIGEVNLCIMCRIIENFCFFLFPSLNVSLLRL